MLDIYYNVSSMTNTLTKVLPAEIIQKSALLLFAFTNIQRQIIFPPKLHEQAIYDTRLKNTKEIFKNMNILNPLGLQSSEMG